MATEYAFTDDSGLTRFEGHIVPDPAGFTPARNVGQCVYDASGAQLTYTAGSPLHLSWEVNQGQSGLLSLTDPTLPAPTVAGVYAVTATMEFVPTSAPKTFLVTLQLDQDFYGNPISQGSGGQADDTAVTVSQTWFCGVGSALGVSFQSEGDGLLSGVLLTVQRIT